MAIITIHISHAPMDFFGVYTLLSEELYHCPELNILPMGIDFLPMGNANSAFNLEVPVGYSYFAQ